MRTFLITTAAIACFSFVYGSLLAQEQQKTETSGANSEARLPADVSTAATITNKPKSKPKPRAWAPFISKGVDWLVKAQNDSGGWGGGSHSNQQERDPHKVKTDPATTSFAALALIRSGSTLESGPNQKQVRSAIEYLVRTVEEASDDGPRITDLKGTQPQTKLGGLVDTTMTTQCLARVLKDTSKANELYSRIDKALDKCVAKLEKAQKADGSWNIAGGWAPVLQTSNGLQALEMAQVSGKMVSPSKITKARAYQKSKINVAGRKPVGGAGAGDAGVELYSFSTAQRGNAVDAAECDDAISEAKATGKLAKDAEVTVDNLKKLGIAEQKARFLKEAFDRNENQIDRLNDANLLKGFGNNGGEEFVSFLLTSESMIIAGGDKWDDWNEKMQKLMQKIQNQDGSWSGHHCITSPVFCTAAVIQCLTVESDSEMLREMSKKNAKQTSTVTEKPAPEVSPKESKTETSETKGGESTVDSTSKRDAQSSPDVKNLESKKPGPKKSSSGRQ